MKKSLLIATVLAVLLSGCDSLSTSESTSEASGAAPTFALQLAGRTFRVEVADTYKTVKRGLSGLKHLDEDAGMLFVISPPRRMRMWMKDCHIPLDVIFFDQSRRMINFHTMEAPKPGTPDTALGTYPSDKPAKYALELVAGTSRQLNLKPGETVRFSGELLNRLGQSTE